MASSPEHMLLADIGATNARLALLSNDVLGPIEWFTVAKFARFTDAIDSFLEQRCRHVSVPEALLAVAGPVVSDRCMLTNCPWIIDAPELCADFGFAKVNICNDFKAVALSLPQLTAADLYPLGGGAALAGEPMVVLGPGTGLGVACFVPTLPNSVVIASEGGHTTMAASSPREDAVIDHLRQEFGHVSAERVVSGTGLEISIARSLRSMESMPHNATRPKSRRQHWTTTAQSRRRPSICCAQCWARSQETPR